PNKIKAMQDWPVPTTLKQLRGFLGLTCYYIKGYASISQPLTVLLRKNAFQWSPQAQAAFKALKQAMIKSPVLALPNFAKEFVIETDASKIAQGVSTDPNKIKAMQDWPVPTTLKQLRGFLGLTCYYRRFIKAFKALKQAMIKSPVLALPNFAKEFVIETDASKIGIGAWRGYLLDRHFKIRTDHFSLKYMLDQRITTPFQSKWLRKLLGFDYDIEYQKGVDNAAADVLSRIKRKWELFSL
nr:hypothetical protein [Tanacetum cinerariifolium]